MTRLDPAQSPRISNGIGSVSVIIVAYRNAEDVQRCLAALSRSTWRAFDVVVVENGGAAAYDDMRKALDSLSGEAPAVTTVCAPSNLGFAGGVNLGVSSRPDADAWWVLNPDTEPEPDALGHLVERLEQGDCEAVGGLLINRNGRLQACGGRWEGWLARAVSIGFGEDAGRPIDRELIERRQNYILGASALVSRRFLSIVGPMRPDYFLYCEEVEWFLRAKKHKMKLGFSPSARVLHYCGTTTGAGGSIRQRSKLSIYLSERNRILLTRDLYPARLAIVALLALPHMLLRYGRHRAWSQLGYALHGWRDGLLDRRGPMPAAEPESGEPAPFTRPLKTSAAV